MAAPEQKTLQNLSGRWKLHKDLSDDHTEVLGIQGVGTMVRKAVSVAAVHLKVSQPSENQLRMEQTATAAGIAGTTEDYTLDWQWRPTHDPFFGDIEARSRWIGVDEAEGEVAKGEWIKGDSQNKLIQAQGKKTDGSWEADHLFGFETVDGERKHTRRTHVKTKDGEEINVRMVYDFEGE